MPDTTLAKATFTKLGGDKASFAVLFNPVSLQHTIANTLTEQRKCKTQYVSQSTAKLSMELVFDTTDCGRDVREHTLKVAKLMQPSAENSNPKKQVPAVVKFEWGAYAFIGMLESFKETIDFFAPNGVPLRATVNVSLVSRDAVFDDQKKKSPVVDVRASAGSVSELASRAGDPRAARGLGAANNQSSLRFSAGAGLSVDASITLGAPAAFASAGAAPSASFGVGGGAALGAAAGGAFAQLREPGVGLSAELDPSLLLPQPPPATSFGASAGTVAIGGRTSQAVSGFGADVGAQADLRAHIELEDS